MTIILTPGRSGSTALSKALALDPKCLSLSEAIINTEILFLPERTFTGEELAELLTRPSRMSRTMVEHGLRTTEFWPGNAGMDEIPPLMVSTLGMIDQLDAVEVQEQLLGWAHDRPEASIGVHISDLFDWLADLSGCSNWVERSGGTLIYRAEIQRLFPDQGTVVLLRDPVRTITSMHRHVGFTLASVRWDLRRLLGVDPYAPHTPLDGLTDRLPEPYRSLLPHTFDPAALDEMNYPLEYVAISWIKAVRRGLLEDPPSRGSVFWIEEFGYDPAGAFDRLGDAIGGAMSEQWAVKGAADLLRDLGRGQAPLDDGVSERVMRIIGPTLERALELSWPTARAALVDR